MNIHQVSRINLSTELVDCIVFWTKNPKPMLKRLDELKNYKYYFQFTLNSYDKTIEPNVPAKKDLIETFTKMSNLIGKERVIWRYDPIILTKIFTKEYHYNWFEKLAQKLSPYTNKCVISFVDLYKKTERNLKGIELLPLTNSDMEEMANNLSSTSSKYGISIETCSEVINLEKYNIVHTKCIDDRLISGILGTKLTIEKDPNQRELCGCIKSIDIGAYNTCNHGCFYCYANFSKDTVAKNIYQHNSKSPLLFGELNENDKIIDREMKSYVDNQISLFDY
jgi:DNA repair photolyase